MNEIIWKIFFLVYKNNKNYKKNIISVIGKMSVSFYIWTCSDHFIYNIYKISKYFSEKFRKIPNNQ
jgi:hypothetical protein